MRKTILLLIIILTFNPLFTVQANAEKATDPPDLVSEAAIMIDSKTGAVLYEKNANEQLYPASLTKIATAIYAIETANLNDIVTVSEKARNVEGTRVYLEEGEQVTLKKLIQGLLINSGNDAGVAIAEHLSGSVEQFSIDINKYLKNVVGVKNTNFENPHGLFDPNHVTTAADLAKITQYAIKNDTFRKIFGTVELEWNGESWDTTLLTHHKLMRQMPYDGVTGGKTGFVNQSGFTLATTAERENLGVIVITLNTNFKSEAYKDTVNLLDYGFANFKRSTIAKGTTFKSGDKEYKTQENLLYTHKVKGQVRKEINDDGTLTILNQDGSVINSYHLNSVEDENVTAITNATEDVKTSSVFGDHILMIVFTAIIIFLVSIGIFLRRLKRI